MVKKLDEKQSEQVVGEYAFTVEQLVSKSIEVLGVEKYVAIGALHDVKGEITITEAKKEIEKFLEKKVN